MAKHKLHRPSPHKSDVLYTTCILRTRVQSPIPYSLIASHLITTSPKIAHKLAKKEARRDIRPKLLDNEGLLKEWLEEYLEGSYIAAEDMESVSWLKAKDCQGSVVVDMLKELGLGDKYKVSGVERSVERGSIEKGIERGESRRYRSSYDEKCMDWRKKSGGLGNEDVPELVDVGFPGRSSEQEPKSLRDMQREGRARAKRFYVQQAKARAQDPPLHLVNEKLESWTKKEFEDRNITGDIKIELRHERVESGSSRMAYKTISGPSSPLSSLPAVEKRTSDTGIQHAEAKQEKEHRERIYDILGRLKAVQQRYGGNFDSGFEPRPWPLPLLGSCYSQLPRIRERIDHQLSVIENLGHLHREEDSDVGSLYTSSWLANPYNPTGQKEERTVYSE